MMSIGMHCRVLGRPGRVRSLERFLDYVMSHNKVWVCRRTDIARHYLKYHNPSAPLASTDSEPAPPLPFLTDGTVRYTPPALVTNTSCATGGGGGAGGGWNAQSSISDVLDSIWSERQWPADRLAPTKALMAEQVMCFILCSVSLTFYLCAVCVPCARCGAFG